MTAYRIKYDWGGATLTEFSYESTTPAFYTGAKLVREIQGYGYIPRSGRVPKADARDTLHEAVSELITQARRDMEHKKNFVNKINSAIGQLESMLNKSGAA